jgi:hypothetical protein
MVTSTFLFLDNQAALRTVGDLCLIFQPLKVNFHSII